MNACIELVQFHTCKIKMKNHWVTLTEYCWHAETSEGKMPMSVVRLIQGRYWTTLECGETIEEEVPGYSRVR